MGGARHDDTAVIPLCRKCHDDAQRYRIPKWRQQLMVERNRAEFLEKAEPYMLERVAEDKQKAA